MAAADEFVYGAAESVVLSGAADVETILYRQAVLGDCLKNRDVVRELYALSARPWRRRRSPRSGSRISPRRPYCTRR